MDFRPKIYITGQRNGTCFTITKNQNRRQPHFGSLREHVLVCPARAACCTCHRSSPPWHIRFINSANSCPVQHHFLITVVFPGRDLRFNNISIIGDGDLAELRHLTTLWVFSSTRRSLLFLLGDVHGSWYLSVQQCFSAQSSFFFTDFLAVITFTQSKLRPSVDCHRSNICK